MTGEGRIEVAFSKEEVERYVTNHAFVFHLPANSQLAHRERIDLYSKSFATLAANLSLWVMIFNFNEYKTVSYTE